MRRTPASARAPEVLRRHVLGGDEDARRARVAAGDPGRRGDPALHLREALTDFGDIWDELLDHCLLLFALLLGRLTLPAARRARGAARSRRDRGGARRSARPTQCRRASRRCRRPARRRREVRRAAQAQRSMVSAPRRPWEPCGEAFTQRGVGGEAARPDARADDCAGEACHGTRGPLRRSRRSRRACHASRRARSRGRDRPVRRRR